LLVIAVFQEGLMTKLVLLLAVFTFALSVSSADAAKNKPAVEATAAPVQNKSDPKQFGYGKRMRARGEAGCRMSGRC
jgi:hypothetical protein